jgi:hypothetical protein
MMYSWLEIPEQREKMKSGDERILIYPYVTAILTTNKSGEGSSPKSEDELVI